MKKQTNQKQGPGPRTLTLVRHCMSMKESFEARSGPYYKKSIPIPSLDRDQRTEGTEASSRTEATVQNQKESSGGRALRSSSRDLCKPIGQKRKQKSGLLTTKYSRKDKGSEGKERNRFDSLGDGTVRSPLGWKELGHFFPRVLGAIIQ